MDIFRCCTATPHNRLPGYIPKRAAKTAVHTLHPAIVSITNVLTSDGKGRGTGVLISPSLVLTTHGTLPTKESATDCEIVLCYNLPISPDLPGPFPKVMLTKRLLPSRLFIVDNELDIAFVACENVGPEVTSLSLNAFRSPVSSMEVGRRCYLLGHTKLPPNNSYVCFGQSKIVLEEAPYICFSSDFAKGYSKWYDGSAGFDQNGQFSFLVCNPRSMQSAISGKRKEPIRQVGVWVSAILESMQRNGAYEFTHEQTTREASEILSYSTSPISPPDSLVIRRRGKPSSSNEISESLYEFKLNSTTQSLRKAESPEILEVQPIPVYGTQENEIEDGSGIRVNERPSNECTEEGSTMRANSAANDDTRARETNFHKKDAFQDVVIVQSHSAFSSIKIDVEGIASLNKSNENGEDNSCNDENQNVSTTATPHNSPIVMDMGNLLRESVSIREATAIAMTTESLCPRVKSNQIQEIRESESPKHTLSDSGSATPVVAIAEEISIAASVGNEPTTRSEEHVRTTPEKPVELLSMNNEPVEIVRKDEAVDSKCEESVEPNKDERLGAETPVKRLPPEIVTTRIQGYGNVSRKNAKLTHSETWPGEGLRQIVTAPITLVVDLGHDIRNVVNTGAKAVGLIKKLETDEHGVPIAQIKAMEIKLKNEVENKRRQNAYNEAAAMFRPKKIQREASEDEDYAPSVDEVKENGEVIASEAVVGNDLGDGEEACDNAGLETSFRFEAESTGTESMPGGLADLPVSSTADDSGATWERNSSCAAATTKAPPALPESEAEMSVELRHLGMNGVKAEEAAISEALAKNETTENRSPSNVSQTHEEIQPKCEVPEIMHSKRVIECGIGVGSQGSTLERSDDRSAAAAGWKHHKLRYEREGMLNGENVKKLASRNSQLKERNSRLMEKAIEGNHRKSEVDDGYRFRNESRVKNALDGLIIATDRLGSMTQKMPSQQQVSSPTSTFSPRNEARIWPKSPKAPAGSWTDLADGSFNFVNTTRTLTLQQEAEWLWHEAICITHYGYDTTRTSL